MEIKEDNKNQDSGKVSPSPAPVEFHREEIFSRSTAAPPLQPVQAPPLPLPAPVPPLSQPTPVPILSLPAPAPTPFPAETVGLDGFKKKRGRPKKIIGPDGNPAVTLSPMPISSSIPLSGEYAGWKQSQVKPIKRKEKLEFCTPGEPAAYPFGSTNFTPHVLTVGSGEDVNMKIISFAQKGARAICVLAANGAISNVTLRQPDSSGGTFTYEGRFDILSLSGAFTLNDKGGAKGMSGGMTVSLAGPDGRVLGGGLAGMLVAAGPVQVILGSFVPDYQHEPQKSKKSRFEPVSTTTPPVLAAMPIFKEATERVYGNEPNISFTLTNTIQNNGSLHGSDPKVLKSSQFEVSC